MNMAKPDNTTYKNYSIQSEFPIQKLQMLQLGRMEITILTITKCNNTETKNSVKQSGLTIINSDKSKL